MDGIFLRFILITLFIVGVSTLAAVGLVAIVRQDRRHRGLMPGTSDVEGFYVTVVGALYAIFLSFMIFVVWSRFYEAITSVEEEANSLANIYRLAAALPQPLNTEIRQSCISYAHAVIRYEWPAMEREQSSPQTWAVVNRMWRIFNRMGPGEVNDSVLRARILDSFIRLTDLRRLRILQSMISLPGVLYTALVFGALLIIGFSVLFGVEGFWPHVIKAGVLASILSFMLFTVWALDHPFQGDIRVPPEAFERTLDIIREFDR